MDEEKNKPNAEWQEDDQKTLIYGAPSETMLSPEELRKALGLPAGDCIQDYEGLSAIGIGGIGAVFSAHEPGLNREVALKILRPQYRNQAERIEWFIREARATAQIDHPNIPPVHRMGVFDDVGVYFTMKRVEGETLRTILRKLGENEDGYRRTYTLHRLMEIFIGACNGVAFAHSHGILHCDLKPGNLMVGDYGEVMVMDWGMARYRADLDRGGAGKNKMELELNCELDSNPQPEAVQEGKVVLGGTPAFMPPEQLNGENTEPTEEADVYGLGAILYTMLTWKSAPFDAELPSEELMRRAVAGRIALPRRAAPRGQVVPVELEAICMKAMASDLSRRYRTVAELLRDVRNFQDGYPVAAYSPRPLYRLSKLIRRHPLIPSTLMAALLTWAAYTGFIHFSNLSQSNSLINLAEYNYTQAKNYNALALRTYNLLREQSESSWKNGRERELENELFRLVAEQENGFNSALEFISRATEYGLRESAVHRMCQDIFKSSLNFYLRVENYDALQSFLRQSRIRWRTQFDSAIERNPELAALVKKIDDRTGELKITGTHQPGRKMNILDPSGKIIALNSVMTEGENTLPAKNLPIGEAEHLFLLPAGSYLLEITLSSGAGVTAPIVVPVAGSAMIELAVPNDLPSNFRYIPGGEFFHGSSSGRFGVGRTTLPPYLIGTNEVTFREYLKFWNSLTTEEERQRYLGWFAFQPHSEERRPIWNEEGTLAEPFTPELPVVGISGEAAEAYCSWLGNQYGLTCRLPTRLEWEKATRGVDGRAFVWGNTYIPGMALLRDHPDRERFPVGAPPRTFPGDVSPYGVRDLTGNVREFLRTPGETGTLYMVVGGSFATDSQQANATNVYYVNSGAGDLGFRYVLEIPANEDDAEPEIPADPAE